MNVISWKHAVKLYFLDKVDVVEEYDQRILTPSLTMNVPSVIKYKYVIKPKYMAPRFSKSRIYLRDDFICQYCQRKLLTTKVTIDHIIPSSRGGKSTWANCVTCCKDCNIYKANRTPKEANMKLCKEPKQPNHIEGMAMRMNTNYFPEIWKAYST